MMAGVLGFHLWATGKVVTQGVGSILGSLTYRVAEIVLVVTLRNVYAIALLSLASNVIILTYYLARVKALPRLTLGYRVLRARVKSFVSFGFQYWLASYMGTAFSSLVAYLVFNMLGPACSSLYGLSNTALGLLTGFSTAVGGSSAPWLPTALGRASI